MWPIMANEHVAQQEQERLAREEADRQMREEEEVHRPPRYVGGWR